ncbi:hypothetical protein [Paucilactobacillus sp. N302-9]
MATYNLVKGQSDWNKYLNDYMNKNYIEATEWSTNGITALNGFKLGKDKDGYDRTVKYRKLQLGNGVSAVEISGAVITPAMNGPLFGSDFLTFPSGVLVQEQSQVQLLGQSYVANDATMVNYNIKNATTMSLTLHGDSFGAGSVIYLNLMYIY